MSLRYYLIAGIGLTAATRATAQHTILELPGTSDFGHSVSAAADFDHDGRHDIAVGAPHPKSCSGKTGFIRVASAATGAQLHQWLEVMFATGFDLDSAGDVNADGFIDLVDAAPDNFADCPYIDLAVVHSGANGAQLAKYFHNTGLFDDLAACGVGDLNGDGFDDVAFANVTYTQVQIYSGKTGTLIVTRLGPIGFGADVSGVGDINLDGRLEYAVGNRTEGGTGSIRIYSGVGPQIAIVNGSTANEWFGEVIDGVGDIDLDGRTDIFVGAPHAAAQGASTGAARVVSGATLQLLASFDGDTPGDEFGRSVTALPDFDGDGRIDLAVGSRGGYARAFDGATLSPFATFHADGMPGSFGSSVDGSGDVDGDGRNDLVIGSPASIEGQNSGVRVVRYCAGAIAHYGTACPGAGGFLPQIAVTGCPSPGEPIGLAIDDTIGGASILIVFGIQPGSLPLANGCTLLVSPLLPPILALQAGGSGPGNGSVALASTIPATAAPITFTIQAFVVDPFVGPGYCATPGVEIAVR